MPKQVDHGARRQEIAEAVCRLAATQGLDAVTLRHVAAEAGVSMGRVQHYFATKDEMLRLAFQVISERYEQRITAAMTAGPPLAAAHADNRAAPAEPGDPRAAPTVLALVDGLMLHLLTGQLDEDAALAALDGYLDRILG